MADTKNIAVFSAKKAIKDYNEKMAGFNDIQSRMRIPSQEQKMEVPMQASLDTHMMQNGMPAQFSVKNAMAKKMGISNYIGTPEQNNMIMMGMQGQAQNKMSENAQKSEQEGRDREHSLKEREFSLREQEVAGNKQPSADEIAESLVSKYKNK